MARPLAEALLRDGHVTRGWLGVAIQDLTPQLARSLGVPATRGVVIMDIEPTGPAATVDLRRGDVVTGLDSETIRSSRQFRNLIATRGAGAEVRIRRERQGQAGEVQVTLRPRPAVQAGPPGTPSPGQPAPANATDVGGMLLAPLTDALRSQYGVSPQVAGSVVVGLRDGSPAASAGLRVGDVVTDINGQPATDPARAEQLYASSFLVAMVGVRRGVDQRIVMLRR
ncbi:MAG: PDZ domain-containing protein [Myxococcota bacterium]|nr:PDZ domain-containing protein [Myxococcota bacterium]